MIFQRAFKAELAQNFTGALLVLVTIAVSFVMLQTLGMAYKGTVNPQEVMLVMTYMVLGQLPILISLTLLLAVVITLSRMYQQSEMVIWAGAGQGLAQFIGPCLRFAWPILATVAVLALLVWPWGHQQANLLRERFTERGDLERVEPGKFQESKDGRRVFFMDRDSSRADGTNIFIRTVEDDGTETVTTARGGQLVTVPGGQMLVLRNGERLEWRAGSEEGARHVAFDTLEQWLAAPINAATGLGQARSLPTWVLLRQPTQVNLAELGWRIGLILMSINFVLFALAAAGGNPRMGQGGKLAYFILAYLLYFNLMASAQDAVAAGRQGFVSSLLALHGGAMAISLWWLFHRHLGWRWAWWRA